MARLLGVFCIVSIILIVLGSALNALIHLLLGFSAMTAAVGFTAHMLAALWAASVHSRRTLVVPKPGFLWAAAGAMTAITASFWAMLILGLGYAQIAKIVSDAPVVIAITVVILVLIAMLGTRYALLQAIQGVVQEEEEKVRDTF